jgi:ribonuclease HI
MEESSKPTKEHLENVWGSNGDKYQQHCGLQALEEGLHVAEAQGYDKLIIEGDSHIIINMFKRFATWLPDIENHKKFGILEASLEAIQQMLASMPVIIPRHVKRSTNKLIDWLANESLRIKEDSWDKPWNLSEDEGFTQGLCHNHKT